MGSLCPFLLLSMVSIPLTTIHFGVILTANNFTSEASKDSICPLFIGQGHMTSSLDNRWMNLHFDLCAFECLGAVSNAEESDSI